MRGAAGAHSDDTTKGRRWPTDLYALACEPGSGRWGEVLAVCVAHDGRHVLHGRPGDFWCQVMPPRSKRRRLAPIEEPLGDLIEERVFRALRRAQAARQAEREA